MELVHGLFIFNITFRTKRFFVNGFGAEIGNMSEEFLLSTEDTRVEFLEKILFGGSTEVDIYSLAILTVIIGVDM